MSVHVRVHVCECLRVCVYATQIMAKSRCAHNRGDGRAKVAIGREK